MTSLPYDEANDADLAEQQRPVDDDDTPPSLPRISTGEADEADALEQELEVGEDDGYDH